MTLKYVDIHNRLFLALEGVLFVTCRLSLNIVKLIIAGGQGRQGLLGVGGGHHQANLRQAAARTQRGAPGPAKGRMNSVIKIFELSSKNICARVKIFSDVTTSCCYRLC